MAYGVAPAAVTKVRVTPLGGTICVGMVTRVAVVPSHPAIFPDEAASATRQTTARVIAAAQRRMS
jgi:hypothetical protein